MIDVAHPGRLVGRRGRPLRRSIAVIAGVALLLGACSGSDDGSDDPDVTVPDSAFDPENPEGTTPPVPGTAVELDDDVIIATEDGSIPAPTTVPPVDPDGPDARPVDSQLPVAEEEATSPSTTAAPVPLPDPAAVGRIVSMSPTHTETLFALGLGEFVVAVDSFSDFPADAEAVRRDDLNASSADLSVLLALEPDVVIVGDDPTGFASRLSAEGVAVYVGPPAQNLDEVYTQIEDISSIVGRPELGDDLTASMRADVARIVETLPVGDRTYFHEIDPSLVTIGPGTFLDSLYGELGLVSIVSGDDGTGFAQLAPDAVIAADPDVIVLADEDCCGVTPDAVAARPGWSQISAVSNGAVVAISDAEAQRWGPRVVDLLRAVAGAVASAG
ncbi:MAG: ABC transporter substrate-binding protein [Ilumatobacter sp.]